MGSPETAAALFFGKDKHKCQKFADELLAVNEDRKELEEETWIIAEPLAYKSFKEYNEKLAVAINEKINKGVTGLIAQRISRHFNVPSIVVSYGEKICTGSLRSARGYNICALLEQCGGIFIDAGGHQAAGGFSIDTEKIGLLLEKLKEISANIEFEDEQGEEKIRIDAELPHDYLSPDILKLTDRFEPYGKDNELLVFMSKNITISEINFVGKPSAKHLKLTLDAGKYKWPAIYWQGAARVLNNEFKVNDKVDIVYNGLREYFRGNITPRMQILDLKKV
jgi:single-stranded-DNA-specific exonuclease